MRKILLLFGSIVFLSSSLFAAEQITIAEFLSRADASTTYRLQGTVKEIVNTKYGNFTLVDETGEIFIWGLLNSNGESEKFSSMGIEEKDLVVLEGKYFLYNGEKPQISAAQYINHYKYVGPFVSIQNFIDLNDGETYRVKGVVTEIQDDYYGNFMLRDETASIFIYGTLTLAGKARKFSTMGIMVGDSVTVSGKYTYYVNPNTGESKHEISDARFCDVVRMPTTGICFPQSFRDGWGSFIGQTVTFNTPLYVCGFKGRYNDTLLVASERVRVPEEGAFRLALGDSAQYKHLEARNNSYLMSLTGSFSADTIRCGAIIPQLNAYVAGERDLQLASPLLLQKNKMPTTPPDMKNASLVVCGANIENYFLHWDQTTVAAKSAENFELQTQKMVNALLNINADIYAICEIECGVSTGNYLVQRMNEAVGVDRYAFVDNGLSEDVSLSSGYIYRKDKVAVTSVAPYFPYSTSYMTWRRRMIIREFEEKATGEKFAISINHFKSKVTDSEQTRKYNADNLKAALDYVLANDYFSTERILILGDFNNYTYEYADHLIGQYFQDLLPHSNLETDYSYVYHGQTGYLDRAFGTNTIKPFVKAVAPYHLNADVTTRHAYYNNDLTIYRYSDHDPIMVGLRFVNDGTPIDNVEQTRQTATKIIENGQFYIINNGVRYTITGQRAQ